MAKKINKASKERTKKTRDFSKNAARRKIKKKNAEAATYSAEENTQDAELNQELKMLEGLKQEQKSEEELQRENGKSVKEFVANKKFLSENETPIWFYIASIFGAYLFTVYISIYAALHFESIEYMNITIVFLFISIVSFFLVSALYFIYEKRTKHSIAPILFFAGIVSIMIYAFKAVDTSNLVRFSIIYTIIVAALSTYILAIKRR